MAHVMLFLVVHPLFVFYAKLYMVSSNRPARAWFDRFSSVVIAYVFNVLPLIIQTLFNTLLLALLS